MRFFLSLFIQTVSPDKSGVCYNIANTYLICEKELPVLEEIRYERDMYEPLREYLTGCGFEVRSEVNTCDLVAKRSDYLVVVEMKRHLSFDLLEQAVERQSYADAVYVCTPKPAGFKNDKKWRSKLRVLKRLGLGLLLVGKIGSLHLVEEALAPEQVSLPRTSPKKRLALCKEFANRRLDLNTGGTHSVPLVTAYRETALYLVFLLDTHGPLAAKDLRRLGGHPRKTTPILHANYYGWFDKSSDKTFTLTDAGKAALTEYAPLIRAFREGDAAAE